PSSVMLAASGFGPAHMIPVVFATLGESQLAEIAQPNFRLGSKNGASPRGIRPEKIRLWACPGR
ncbi:hypothetical protein QLH51_19740, partial [Sphingomonas sp. 2R-10]|uniref:hypothetical protein n=1 Tax=Sphingomonas sp. 2R-10 TaxID=3045148 RepID=UPI0024B92CD9